MYNLNISILCPFWLQKPRNLENPWKFCSLTYFKAIKRVEFTVLMEKENDNSSLSRFLIPDYRGPRPMLGPLMEATCTVINSCTFYWLCRLIPFVTLPHAQNDWLVADIQFVIYFFSPQLVFEFWKESDDLFECAVGDTLQPPRKVDINEFMRHNTHNSFSFLLFKFKLFFKKKHMNR